MFSLLRAAMTLLICVLIVGFYLGWFTFSRPTPDPRSNKVNINVSVDKSKVRSDLQSAEQTLAKRLQDVNNQPQGNGMPAPSNQPMAMPRLNIGPISIQPSGQGWAPPAAPPASQPPMQSQTPDYQYNTAPIMLPPPGEGR